MVSWRFSAKVRGGLSQMFLKMDVLKNFGIFTGKLLSWSLFLINFYYIVTLSKRDSKNRCSPVNIAKFLRTAFL